MEVVTKRGIHGITGRDYAGLPAVRIAPSPKEDLDHKSCDFLKGCQAVG